MSVSVGVRMVVAVPVHVCILIKHVDMVSGKTLCDAYFQPKKPKKQKINHNLKFLTQNRMDFVCDLSL